jgi:hypothetical protein
MVQVKESRDATNGATSAAGEDGRFAQACDNLVDSLDRVSIRLRRTALISAFEIEERYEYENENLIDSSEVVFVADVHSTRLQACVNVKLKASDLPMETPIPTPQVH